jgi:hypothetical protein
MMGARSSRSEEVGTTARANVAVDLVPPGRISVGGEVPGEHLCALARVTVWMVGALLSALIPAITLRVSRGLLTPTEDLVLVGVQFLLATCFTAQASRSTGRFAARLEQAGGQPRRMASARPAGTEPARQPVLRSDG